jgi:hypothetical protein
MSNAATQSAPFGLTPCSGTDYSTGIAATSEGTYTALTRTESKTFRTVKGAAAWLARRGYSPTGTRLDRCACRACGGAGARPPCPKCGQMPALTPAEERAAVEAFRALLRGPELVATHTITERAGRIVVEAL